MAKLKGGTRIYGNIKIDGGILDSSNNIGVGGSVLISTVTGIAWTTAGVSVVNDISTAVTEYPLFSNITSGNLTILNVSNTKLQFVPSSGTLSATVFTSLSDATQKTDISSIENPLSTVMQLNGVKYRMKDNPDKLSIGVIAQDVEKVLPEVVTENADGLKTVSYGNIIGLLIEAIKEQQIRIEELEKKINA